MNKKALVGAIAVVGCLFAGVPEASASGLEVRLGGFKPRMNSNFFDDTRDLYLVEKDDFVGAAGGIEFTKTLASNIEVGFSIDGYGREVFSTYRNFTRPSGREIEQTLKFALVPVSAIVRAVPTSRYRKLAPYVGAGVSSVFYTYEEFGDFIDFDDPGRAVIFDSFKSDGVGFAVVLNAGLRYRLNEDFQITADFRNFSGKHKLKGDFGIAGNEIDLSGGMFTIGARVTF